MPCCWIIINGYSSSLCTGFAFCHVYIYEQVPPEDLSKSCLCWNSSTMANREYFGRRVPGWMGHTTRERILQVWEHLGLPQLIFSQLNKKPLLTQLLHLIEVQQFAITDAKLERLLDSKQPWPLPPSPPDSPRRAGSVQRDDDAAGAPAPRQRRQASTPLPEDHPPQKTYPGPHTRQGGRAHVSNDPNQVRVDGSVSVVSGKLRDLELAILQHQTVTSVRLMVTADHDIFLSQLGKPYPANFELRGRGDQYDSSSLDSLIYLYGEFGLRDLQHMLPPQRHGRIETALREITQTPRLQAATEKSKRLLIYRRIVRNILGGFLDPQRIWDAVNRSQSRFIYQFGHADYCFACGHVQRSQPGTGTGQGQPAYQGDRHTIKLENFEEAKREEWSMAYILQSMFGIASAARRGPHEGCPTADPRPDHQGLWIPYFLNEPPPWLAVAPNVSYKNVRRATDYAIEFTCIVGPEHPTSASPLHEETLCYRWRGGMYMRNRTCRTYQPTGELEQEPPWGACQLLDIYDPRLHGSMRVSGVTPVHPYYQVPDQWAEGTSLLFYERDSREMDPRTVPVTDPRLRVFTHNIRDWGRHIRE